MTQNYGLLKVIVYFKSHSGNFKDVSCKLSRCQSPANHRWLVYYSFSFIPDKKISLHYPDCLRVECNKVNEYWPMAHGHKWCILGTTFRLEPYVVTILRDTTSLRDGRAINWKDWNILNNYKICYPILGCTIHKKETYHLLSLSECKLLWHSS